MGKLDNKIAIVTGGTSGIGKSIAELFVKEGSRVVIASIDENKGPDIAKKLNCLFIKADVSKEAEVKILIEKTVEKFGKLDIMINNAGVYKPKEIEKLTEKEWREILSINLDGVFFGTKYSVSHLKKTKGTIINTASTLGYLADTECGAYCVSKAGVIMLTKVAALELIKYGIRVNCVCPGPIDTPIFEKSYTKDEIKKHVESTLLKRFGKPEEAAKVFLFLASDDASYVTGSAYNVDGGEGIG